MNSHHDHNHDHDHHHHHGHDHHHHDEAGEMSFEKKLIKIFDHGKTSPPCWTISPG